MSVKNNQHLKQFYIGDKWNELTTETQMDWLLFNVLSSALHLYTLRTKIGLQTMKLKKSH
jgi:hypothetical protein